MPEPSDIRSFDGVIISRNGKIANSDKCFCVCEAECISVEFSGFECDWEVDGTYTLVRSASDPHLFGLCETISREVEEVTEETCRAISLTASCEGYQISMVFGCPDDNVGISASAGRESPCDSTTFSNVVASVGFCTTLGTITTSPSEGCSPEESSCCQACYVVNAPGLYRIRLTSEGSFLNPLGDDYELYSGTSIPEYWNTRSYRQIDEPLRAIQGGKSRELTLFAEVGILSQECDTPVVFLEIPLKTWEVRAPYKCRPYEDGNWHHSEYLGDSVITTCDGPFYPSIDIVPQYVADVFVGGTSCDWADMFNWYSTGSAVSGENGWGNNLLDLPTPTTDVSIEGEVTGNSSTGATVEVNNLTVGASAVVRIPINVAGTASISGLIDRGCVCPDYCNCVPVGEGAVFAQGEVTIGGSNNGNIQSDVKITLEGSATNYGWLSSPIVEFINTSVNYADGKSDPRGDCQISSIYGDTVVLSSDIRFKDSSSNNGTMLNAGPIFYDTSANNGDLQGSGEFRNNSANNGVLGGSAYFYDSSENNGEVGTPGATFYDTSTNNGKVTGPTTLQGDSINAVGGIIVGETTMQGFAKNNGSITGNVTLSGSAENSGTIQGDATFGDDSINYGNVLGNATFNDNSSNFGTVTGTVTCNTTGTCQ
jgi:hypothetical protein